jgi:predicted DsbA family dithiol-disulfide isomerase
MRIEIWSDIACPFCYIGKRHLEEALRSFEHRGAVDLVWRSFQLSPDAPREVDANVHDVLARKYGRTREEARGINDRVTAMAAAAGLEYDLDRTRPTNTLDAHRLTHLAAAHGLADRAVERLMAAYLTEGAHLGDAGTLVRLGGEIGLDEREVAEALASDAYADAVLADADEAHRLGLNAVPAFVIDRSFLISGAQPAEAMLGGLRQAWERRPPP